MAHVLLIEDDRDQLRIRKLMLEAAGHTVAAAESAEAAFSAFDSSVDAVIMDLRVPREEDGRDLIRRFRAVSRDVRIIVLSGWMPDFTSLPEAALVDAWAVKPLPSRKLLDLLA
jgi:DNA-binding response OmpR family regulator